MQISSRLKEARLSQGLTQEALAERLHVSRQTISKWENDRSYPDISSVIALSDLYAISLDELLKEDKNMIAHLEESTDIVTSRKKLSKLLLIAVYLLIWTLSILFFWLGGGQDAMGYSLVILYLILPVATLVSAFFIGRDDAWTDQKWLMLLFFGALYMLAPYATFSVANVTSTGILRFPELTAMLPGILCAAAGMAAGSLTRRLHRSKN